MAQETFTAFLGTRCLAWGDEGSLIAELAPLGAHPEGLLVFSDQTGRQTDLNLTGADLRPPIGFRAGSRPRGRPKLGVKAREVTLLPRHWEWLRSQRGGASATLRRLVDDAIRGENPSAPNPDAAYRFMTAIAGDLPGYEAAIRALYAGNAAGFATAIHGWPDDIRTHALSLARIE